MVVERREEDADADGRKKKGLDMRDGCIFEETDLGVRRSWQTR